MFHCNQQERTTPHISNIAFWFHLFVYLLNTKTTLANFPGLRYSGCFIINASERETNTRNETHEFDSQIFVSHVTFRLEIMKLLASQHALAHTSSIDACLLKCVAFDIRAHHSNGMSHFYDFKFRRNQFWKFILRALLKCVDHKTVRFSLFFFFYYSARILIQFSATFSLPLPRCLVCVGIWLTGLTRWKINKQWRREKIDES